MKDHSSDDLKLAARIRSGDSKAFDTLFRRYYVHLCDVVFHLVRSHDATEDIVQEVFCRMWVERSTWLPNISVRAYLEMSVRNSALNYIKHQRVVVAAAEKESELLSGDVAEEMDRRAVLRRISEAVDLLPQRCRVIFLMSREDGLTYTEISAKLGISNKTVETQIGRALKVLRRSVT